MAIALMRAGKRVGVTSLSHKAINNLLRAVQHEADRQGFAFRGAKRGGEGRSRRRVQGSLLRHLRGRRRRRRSVLRPRRRDGLGADASTRRPARRRAADRRALRRRGRSALARRRPRGRDERALARSCSATRTSCRRSRRARIRRARALRPPAPARRRRHDPARPRALPRGDLAAAARAAATSPPTRTTRAGCGRADHGDAVARGGERAGVARRRAPPSRPVVAPRRPRPSRALVAALVGTPFTDDDGTRPLRHEDILVVAPYNAQVRTLRSKLPPAVRGGHGRQVPGPGGACRRRLDGELDARGRAARDRVRLRPAPLQRRHVARPVPGRARLRAGAARRRLPDGGADAARGGGVPVRGARGRNPDTG